MTAAPSPPSSGRYALRPCPFCGSEIRHVESWAKSFQPNRLYHEWHHVSDNEEICPVRRHIGKIVASTTDDVEMQDNAICRWNNRTGGAAQPPDWRRIRDILTTSKNRIPSNDPQDYCGGEKVELLAKEIAGACGVAQGVPEPVMWVCLVPNPLGELRIRAWTADRKRMESLRDEGLDMQALYTASPPALPAGEIIQQHISWLFQYVRCMTADNWRDMRDNADRQLEQLSEALAISSTDRLCPNGLEHGNCGFPDCVSSCPGRLSLTSTPQATP